MSDAVQIAIITTLINAAVVMFSRWLSHREHAVTSGKVDTIEKNTNGIKDDLVRAARAEGKAEGIAEARIG